MAQKIDAKIQRMLIPHINMNGEMLYKDYGFAYITIYNMDNTPPTPFFTGMVASGRFEIEANSKGTGLAGYSPMEDGNMTTGELMPIVRHKTYRIEEEATGMLVG